MNFEDEHLARADRIAAQAQCDVGPTIAAELEGIRRRLTEPLRVAIAGPVNSGKSTLVNSLLRQQIAPTDVSECTRVITEFRFGHPQRCEIELRDGSTRTTTLAPGPRLPTRLGVPADDVAMTRVWLANDLLRSMTLLDTPGVNSANVEISERTTTLLTSGLARMDADSRWAAEYADAVVFVINPALQAAAVEVLHGGGTGSADAPLSALTTLGILTKADKLGDGDDPMLRARELATRQSERLRSELSTVVPVIGLLAETAETYALTDTDTADLRTLAAAEADGARTMLWGVDHFLAADVPVSVERRHRLLSLLDLYGLRVCLELATAGILSAEGMRLELSRRSGLSEVRRIITTTLGERSALLRTHTALSHMRRLTYRGTPAEAPTLARLRASIERLLDDPPMHELALLEAVGTCLRARVPLPPHLNAMVGNLTRETAPAARCGLPADTASPDAVERAAIRCAGDWQAYGVSGVGAQAQHAARVFTRTYTHIVEWSRSPEADPHRQNPNPSGTLT